MATVNLTFKHPEAFHDFLNFISKTVLYILGIGLLSTAILFVAGGSLKDNIILLVVINLLAIGLLFLEYYWVHKYSIRHIMVFLITSYLIGAACTSLATFIYDKSWDGMAYHQITVLKLYDGWNPVYEVLPATAQESKYYTYKVTLNNYVNHYPKAHEILGTLFFITTNRIESGKVINLLLILASFCSVFTLVNKLGLHRFWAYGISVAAALNPIALNQVFSYYLDGALGSLLLIFLSQLILLYVTAREKSNYFVMISLFFLIILICNIKFTAIIYAVLFCLLFTLFLAIYKEYFLLKRFLGLGIGSGLVAVFLIGFNPYVINTIDHGHPFHPLAGKNKEDIITPYLPSELSKANTATKFFSSTFSESANFDSRNKTRQLKLKFPFTFNVAEMKAFQSEGVRIGGFGVLWSGIFLFCILFTPIAIYLAKGHQRFCLTALLLAILMSVIINPESWWARFIPQLWMYPIVLIFTLFFYGDKKIRIGARGILLVLILNSVVTGAVSMSSTIKNTMSIRKDFRSLSKLDTPIHVYFDIFTPLERRLTENKIKFIKVDKLTELPCSTPTSLSKFDYCLP